MAELGEARVRAHLRRRGTWSCSTSFCAHGRAVRAERARAGEAGRAPDFVPLVRGWGGVSIAYRKRMVDSPAYRLNHEEVIKALEEGIAFVENVNPIEAVPDADGAVQCDGLQREAQEGQGGQAPRAGRVGRA